MADYERNASETEFVQPDVTPMYGPEGDDYWLAIARDSWTQGDDYFTTSMRPRIERNLAHFKSKHAPGSKYHQDEFRKRSRLFRPKTRTAIRKHAAAVVRAFFATDDAMTCEPVDPSMEKSKLAAAVHQAILNYRLKNSTPWYQITVAALTEACIHGIVISKQFWDYEEEEIEINKFHPAPDGGVVVEPTIVTRMLRDRPMSRIVPLENIRISSASDWLDPMSSTPFIIEQRPYYVADLKERIDRASVGGKTSGQIPYRPLSDAEIRRGKDAPYDSIRSSREDNNDRFNDLFGGQRADYDVVWVRECIIRIGKMDYYYETVGETILLSDPVPLSVVSKIGRGYRMGKIEIEPHTLQPEGVADMSYALQTEANEISNTRMDNVKLSMTGRFIVARGRQTDIRSLMRNVPGSITYSQSTNDVKDMRSADVTSSSYQEQDRLNLDMDDLLGTFSQSTVQSNRQLNETVGGMAMLQQGASEITEMEIRNFSETWYEPVLRDMVSLQSNYESDKTVIELAGRVAKTEGVTEAFRLVQMPAKVVVNVGFGNTNPMMRIERLNVGLSTLEQYVPGSIARADGISIAREIFGALGYKDASQFFPHLSEDAEEDPQIAGLQQQIEELTGIIESGQIEHENKLNIEKVKAKSRAQIEGMRQQTAWMSEKIKDQIKRLELKIKETESEIAKRELYMQREALSQAIHEADRHLSMEEARFEREMSQPVPEGGANQELVDSLRSPSSGKPIKVDGTVMSDVSDGKAGVMARGDYGMIPGKEG